jgi:two-component system phosphate regulon sensor histidine kinase PhoR
MKNMLVPHRMRRFAAAAIRHGVAEYAAVVTLVLVTVFIRLWLDGLIGTTAPFLLFLLPVLFSAWLGGLGPGLFATLLALGVVTYAFIGPPYASLLTESINLQRIVIFTLEGTVISAVCHRMRSAERGYRGLRTELETQVQRRTEDLRRERAHDLANLERLRNMIAHLPFGAMVLDDRRTIVEMNGLFCDYLGVDAAAADLRERPIEVLELAIRSRFEDCDACLEALRAGAGPDGAPVHREFRGTDDRTMLADFVPVSRGGDGGMIVLLRDVTRERRADRSKSDFMSLASHQLRTPLTIMKWSYSKLRKSLREGQLTATQMSYLVNAQRASERMANTINTMLAISQIESGATRIAEEPVRLRDVLQELRQHVFDAYSRKKQRFTLVCPDDVRLRTDVRLLGEIVGNLLSNAIKYTPEGGSIEARAVVAGDRVRISVADTGFGIPANQQPRIFRKFFRADNVAQMDPDGTGLGLYLVSLMTKMLRGEISFLSEEGKGTTFTVDLALDGARLPEAEMLPDAVREAVYAA